MKIMLLPSSLVAAASFCGLTGHTQDAPPLAPPPPPPPPPEVAAPTFRSVKGLPGGSDLGPMITDLQRQLQGQVSQVGAVVQDVMTLLPGNFAGMEGMARGGARPGRTLVLPNGGGGSGTNVGNAEEDLNVMARILEKALAAGEETDDRRAMGIAISSLGSPAGAPRNLYLEGYGAVFFLEVAFPLLPPPKKTEEVKAKPPVSSEWEEARRELNAARSPEPRVNPAFRNARGGVEYDADKVDRLKDDLLESLKNASHIRDLKPEESITVVVTGSSGNRTQRVVRRNGGDGKNIHAMIAEVHRDVSFTSGGAGASSESTMTLRVRKADADAFASGKINLEEFRKRSTTRNY